MENKKSKNGIIGLAIGDALGVPAEFKSREILKKFPIITMIGNGSYYVPAVRGDYISNMPTWNGDFN